LPDTSVLLVGEGSHELGPYRDEFAPSDHLPPLAQLVRRLLRDPAKPRFFCRLGKDVPNVHRGKMASRDGKKVYSAIRYARRRGWGAAVVVVDRDGPRNAGRLAGLHEGAREASASFPCAVGLAIETFDAWMIVDRNAIKKAGGDQTKAHDNPESLTGKKGTGKHPKDVADAIFGTTRGSGLGPKYATVAEHLDLALLETACPKGFRPFADEVRERIEPVLTSE